MLSNKSTSEVNDAQMQRFWKKMWVWAVKNKSLRPFGAELLRLCRCEVLEASGTFHSKTHASPNLPTFKRIKHWSFMNMEELHFEIERWCRIFWPCFAVSAFSTLPPPEHRLRC